MRVRKLFFQYVRSSEHSLDLFFMGLIMTWNLMLLEMLDLWSEGTFVYLPVLTLYLYLRGPGTSRERCLKSLLRLGDCVSFRMKGQVRFGFVEPSIPEHEVARMELDPKREYVVVSDEKGELKMMLISNVMDIR